MDAASAYDEYIEQYCPVQRGGQALAAQLLAHRDQGLSGVEFYVHYMGHDRRMDEWVGLSAVDLASAKHEVCVLTGR